MKEQNQIQTMTYNFAKDIILVYKDLTEKKMYDIGRQLLRSWTSIGANIEEWIGGQSGKDFLSKLSIAYKEARETKYWINLLYETNIISQEQYDILSPQIIHIINILSKIIRTRKSNNWIK